MNTHILRKMLISLLSNKELGLCVERKDTIIVFLSYFLLWHKDFSTAVRDNLDIASQVRTSST
jgi:hypothetical protein